MIRKGFVKYRKWAVMLLLAMTLLCLWLAVRASDAARWPQEPGKNIKRDGNLKIDIATASEGYFQASLLDAGSNKYKMRVARGNTTLTYNLNNKAEFEIFPLQLGDGNYEVTLYKNVSGNKYSQAGRISFSAKLSSKEVCFLYPNQYVNYTIESEAVKKSDELCAGMTEKQSYEAICSYMKSTFAYDFIKAITVTAGTLPDVEGCYSKKIGICQDLAAVMCCMLRTQGIPARLTIGYADNGYHAWVTIKRDNKELFFDPTAAVNGINKVKSYTPERYY